MKGLIILNSLIVLLVMIIKRKFKPKISIPYNKEIKRFNVKALTKNRIDKKGLYIVNDRFSFKGDVLLFVIYLTFFSIWQSYALSQTNDSIFRLWFLFIGFVSSITVYLSIFEEVVSGEVDDQYKLVMAIPVYNEDVLSLSGCLDSILRQSRLPDEVHITDDGSDVDYQDVIDKYTSLFAQKNIIFSWQYQSNSGKRKAQIACLKNINCSKTHAIVVTVDSDGILSDDALEEGIKPFQDSTVQSVAGVVVSKQVNKNVLSRIVDLIIVIQQQYERAALSALGTVSVNSGALAFYRYEVIDNAVNMNYLDETFANRELKYSDDSYLTLIALSMGKTVTQRTAVSFADMPINFNHHYRQQLRWMRGSFVRGMWRIKVTPINSITFARQLIGWQSYFSSLYIIVYVLIQAVLYQRVGFLWHFLITIMMSSYILNLKYLKIKRSDISFKQQFLTYLCSPVAFLWNTIVIRTIKLIAILTIFNNEWGTRTAVEAV